MKRWAILTTLIYILALCLLTLPVLLAAFGGWANHSIPLREAVRLYLEWGYWVWLAVPASGMLLFLRLPASLADRRQPARRPVKTPVLVTAFFLCLLFIAGLASILCALYKEDGLVVFRFLAGPAEDGGGADDMAGLASFGAVLLFAWLVWIIVFRHFARNDTPEDLLKRCIRWLLRGSILEMLIAVPSHIVVRNRGDCCAPFATFWGMVTGISVLLLCFGPGVLYLFIQRMRRLQSAPGAGGHPPEGLK